MISYKEIYERVAKNLNLDYSLVESVSDYVWEDLVNKIETYEDTEFYIYKLGSWRIRRGKVNKYLENLNQIYNVLLKNNFFSEEKKNEYLNKISVKIKKVEELIRKHQEIMDIKMTYKKKTNEVNGSIQEQKSDMGGTEKQDI